MPLASITTFAVSAALAAIASVWLACAHDRETLLALDFVAFDQTEGSGWRPLYRDGCYAEVAELLREWRTRRGASTPLIIPFHEAQMWAFAGRNELALP